MLLEKTYPYILFWSSLKFNDLMITQSNFTKTIKSSNNIASRLRSYAFSMISNSVIWVSIISSD